MTTELTPTEQTQLTAQQEAFVEYLANPNDHREQREIAEILKVHETTLSKWKAERKIQDAVWNLIIDKVRTDDLAQIWSGLLRSAKKGDTKATKLIFEVLGKYAPGPENQVNVQNNMIVQVISQIPEEQ